MLTLVILTSMHVQRKPNGFKNIHLQAVQCQLAAGLEQLLWKVVHPSSHSAGMSLVDGKSQEGIVNQEPAPFPSIFSSSISGVYGNFLLVLCVPVDFLLSGVTTSVSVTYNRCKAINKPFLAMGRCGMRGSATVTGVGCFHLLCAHA